MEIQSKSTRKIENFDAQVGLEPTTLLKITSNKKHTLPTELLGKQ